MIESPYSTVGMDKPLYRGQRGPLHLNTYVMGLRSI